MSSAESDWLRRRARAAPYGTGPSPVYHGSGYLPSGDYWRLGAIFGLIFFVVFVVLTAPGVLAR